MKGLESFPKAVQGEQGLWAGKVTIIKGDVCIKEILTANGTDRDHYLTLNECLEKIGGTRYGQVVTVIMEQHLEGRIYRYGNYFDGKWYQIGTTCGYA